MAVPGGLTDRPRRIAMTEKQKRNLARLAGSGLETGDRRTLALALALAGGDPSCAVREAMRRKDAEWLANAADALEGVPGWEQAREALLAEARMFSPYAVPREAREKIWAG